MKFSATIDSSKLTYKTSPKGEPGSGGMSCNNAKLITQNVSEVVTHYTGYYTAKNRKKCLNYTKIHKFQG